MSLQNIDRVFHLISRIHDQNIDRSSELALFYRGVKKNERANSRLKKLYKILLKNIEEDYGVVGGGIGLLSTIDKKPKLLFARSIKKEIYGVQENHEEVLDSLYHSFGEYKDLINLSFFAARETKVPEYVTLLNFGKAEIKRKRLLSKNRFIVIEADEIKGVLDEYHSCLAQLFKKKGIDTSEKLLRSGLGLPDHVPDSILLKLIPKLNEERRSRVLNVLGIYIEKVRELSHKSIASTTPEAKIQQLYQQAPFPILSYSFIYLFRTNTKVDYSHIVFPIWNAYTSHTAYKVDDVIEYSLIHGLFTVSSNGPDLSEEKLLEFKLLLRQLAEPIIDKEHYEKIKINDLKEIKETAVRNAIAALMSRNMSHNIGSHALSRLVSPDSILLYSRPDFVHQFKGVKVSNNYYRYQQNKFVNQISSEFSKFFSYLKSRQDLLADIVSGIPQVQSTKRLGGSVMSSLCEIRVLLDLISGSKDFNYGFSFEGELKTNEISQQSTTSLTYSFSKDIDVALSNDILGEHCIYIILENVIRNTAKHGFGLQNSLDCKFTIRVEEATLNSGYYGVTVFDNRQISSNLILVGWKSTNKLQKAAPIQSLVEIDYEYEKFYQQRINQELHYVGVRQFKGECYQIYSISEIDKLILDQNIRISQSILSEQNQLRSNGLGLIEMQVCAAYLRKIDVSEIGFGVDPKEFNPENIAERRRAISKGKHRLPIFRALNPWSIEYHEGKPSSRLNVLGYKFYLPKPREMVIFDQTGEFIEFVEEYSFEKVWWPNLIKRWEKRGVAFTVGEENKKRTNEMEVLDSGRSYQEKILLYTGTELKNESKLPVLQIDLVTFLSGIDKYYGNNEVNADGFEQDTRQILEDIIQTPSKLIAEATRTLVRQKANSKGLQFEDGNYSYLIGDLSGTQFKCILHHHGEGYNSKGDERGDYHELYPSSVKPYFDRLTNAKMDPDNAENITKILRFCNATLSNVLVLDERIQEMAMVSKVSNVNMNYAEVWDVSGVHIPPVDSNYGINLNAVVFDSTYLERVKQIIIHRFGQYAEMKCKNLDFIIVHLGVLEKMMNGLEMDKSDLSQMDAFIKDAFYNDDLLPITANAKLIITSGRGPQADALPSNYGFLNYSVISKYLIEYRLKHDLIDVLISARPKTKL